MYEARQNKEKVSRRIDGGGVRQRVKFSANKMNSVRVHLTPWKYDRSKYPVQRVLYGNPSTAEDLIKKQIELQNDTYNNPAKISEKLNSENQSNRDPNFFTTIGYEFEFIQLKDEGNDSVLQNVIHVELGKSNEKFKYTDLPFSLETDAKGTIELVTPPFIIDTLPKTSIPEPDDIQKVSNLMEVKLNNIVQNVKKLNEIQAKFKDLGIEFPSLSATISSENMLGAMSPDLKSKSRTGDDKIILNYNELYNLDVVKSKKVSSYRPDSSIATQVNIAMTTEDYLKVKDLYSLNREIGKCITDFRKEIVTILKNYLSISGVHCSKMNIKALIEEIAMYLINTLSLQYMKDYRDKGKEFFKPDCRLKSNQNDYHLESGVKDFRGVWFKDSIRSLTTDLLQNNEKTKFVKGLRECIPIINNFQNRISQSKEPLYNIIATAIKEAPFKDALTELINFIENPKKEEICTRAKRLCEEGVNMGKYDARPDTYLPNIQAAPGLTNKKLHVVESRYLSTKPLVTWLNILKYEHNLFA